jgi:hypothetical protein
MTTKVPNSMLVVFEPAASNAGLSVSGASDA